MTQLRKNKTEQHSSELLSKKITEENMRLKKENEDLRKAHAELNTLFGSIDEILYSVDMTSFKVLQISAACEKVTGYSSEEFLTDPDLWKKIVYPEDKNISKQQVKLLSEGKLVLNQYRIIHKNKSVCWIENKIIPTLDDTGRLIRIDAVTNDITERKRAKKKLEESISILEATIESTADGILVADLNGKIIRFNKKFVELWHIPGEILETKDDNKAINYVLDQLTDPEKFLSKLGELQARPKDVSFDILEFKDGRVFERYSQPQLINEECAGRVWSFRDITKRKNDEEAIKESESQLALATKIAKLGYWEFDAIKGLFTFNDQFYSLFKTTAEEVGGYIMDPQRYSELFVFPDDRDFVIAEVARTIGALESGFNNRIEHRIIYANGEVGWISANFFLIKNDEGVTIKTFGVNQDITDHKKAEEALSNNELRFRTLTSNAPVGIFQTDVNGKTSYVNETWLRYTDLQMNEALGDGWAAAVHPDDRNEQIQEWNNKSEKGLKSSSEYRLINKKGNIRWVSGEAIPLFNNVRKVTGYIGTLSDITERKKADEALRLAQFTIENTTHAIYWIKSDGSFHMVNNAATQMLGFSFEELMQLNVPGIDPFYNKEVWDGFWQAIINQKFMRLITKHIRKDGTLIDVQIDTHYFRFENLEMSCAFVSDITDQKKAEETLRISEANLELKNKELELINKELEQFAYVASHDMQEPLRTTSSFVELLQEQYKGKLDEKADKYLSFITQSSDRMKILIKDLLDYSRIGKKQEWEQVDCKAMLREVIADLDLVIKETQTEIKADCLPVIRGFSTEIKQLFQNLLINAIKFRKKNIASQITISVQKIKNNWEFVFKDNGIGIEEKHQERIFVIFQRLHTRSEYEGSGIGLAHCKKIVELHGGKIWIESVSGNGSAFHFTIPENGLHTSILNK